MARIFITGSSDGLGSLTAQALTKKGHTVVLHARNAQRAKDAQKACPGAETVLTANLSSLSETKKLADEVNKHGPFDCVIHNAGLYRGGFRRTEDGFPALMAINTLAPYVLTCLIKPKPKRLVFVSSGLHSGGDTSLRDIVWAHRGEKGWSDMQGYSDSKLHNIILAKAFARRWRDVESNSLDPGWVPTKMGGAGAMDDINKAVDTYVMLAEGTQKPSGASGRHWYQGRERRYEKKADDAATQDKLISELLNLTGVGVPSHEYESKSAGL